MACGGRTFATLITALLTLAVAAPSALAAEDEVIAPAPGEPQPLEDPTEPAGAAPAPSRPALEFTAASGLVWPAPNVTVLAGASRYDTAVTISQAGWPDGAPAVVLASGEDYPDALAAAALAGAAEGPMLLTGAAELSARTADELKRLAPDSVFVVGGAKAVGPKVVAAVEDMGATVERIGGANRYQTAYAIAERVLELDADTSTVLLASGEGFADALSASGIAAGLGHPILLVSAATDPDELAARVAELEAETVLVIGGAATVPDAPLQRLQNVTRVSGPDRTQTAKAVAVKARELGLAGAPALASAETFPDGLTGGVLAGAILRAPVLLTGRSSLSTAVMEWLAGDQPQTITQFGGAAAVGGLATCQLQAGEPRPWRCVEQEMARQGYNVGAVDGQIDHQSPWAVYALQKVAGLNVTGSFGDAEWHALVQHPTLPPRHPELGPDHLEIDLPRQLILLFRGGRMAHAFHTSSGKPSTPTVRGTFTVYRKLDYRNASNMYKPIYFYRRYALHGYPSVPLSPASAGCARMYDRDMDFLWPLIKTGERVAVY